MVAGVYATSSDGREVSQRPVLSGLHAGAGRVDREVSWVGMNSAPQSDRPGVALSGKGPKRVIVAVIQARMGSNRFPGKTLADLGGRPMLARVVARVSSARSVDCVVVATSTASLDDPIAEFCQKEQIACFRGSENDLLDRFHGAAKEYGADAVVRITADCPLIDPDIIDRVIERFQRGDCDYASNALRYTYPDGLDTEVFSMAALEQAWGEAKKPSEREHVTPYLRSGKFRAVNVENEAPLDKSQRWTVDHPGDLEFVRGVYSAFGGRSNFRYQEVVQLLKERPDLAATQTDTITNEGYYRSLYQQAKAGAAPK